MSAYPGRNHTKRAVASVLSTPLCLRGYEKDGYAPGLGQPDADCRCDGCLRYFATKRSA